MNCRRFQDRLHEYLDGDLSPWGQASAERHLAGCNVCRCAVQREREFAEALGRQLQSTARPFELDADFRHRLVRILTKQTVETVSTSGESWFRQVPAWVPQAAAAIVLLLLGVLFFSPRRPGSGAVAPARAERANPIAMQVSYTVPTYTFRREDGFVVDTLSWHTNVITETLWVDNGKSLKPQTPL